MLLVLQLVVDRPLYCWQWQQQQRLPLIETETEISTNIHTYDMLAYIVIARTLNVVHVLSHRFLIATSDPNSYLQRRNARSLAWLAAPINLCYSKTVVAAAAVLFTPIALRKSSQWIYRAIC